MVKKNDLNFYLNRYFYLDPGYVHQNSTSSSSPIFYEKPGIPEINDDHNNDEIMLSPNGTRRVKFSNAPIRVR